MCSNKHKYQRTHSVAERQKQPKRRRRRSEKQKKKDDVNLVVTQNKSKIDRREREEENGEKLDSELLQYSRDFNPPRKNRKISPHNAGNGTGKLQQGVAAIATTFPGRQGSDPAGLPRLPRVQRVAHTRRRQPVHTQHCPATPGQRQDRSGLDGQVAGAEGAHPDGLQALSVHPVQRRGSAGPESGDGRSRSLCGGHGLHHQHFASSAQAGRVPSGCPTR